MKRSLLAHALVFAFMILFCHNLNASDNCEDDFNCSRIYDGEVTDTTLYLKRDTVITMKWIYRKLHDIQKIGRPQELDYYGLKLYRSSQNVDSIIKEFIREQPRDTIFIYETINKDGTYNVIFWRDKNEAYTYDLRRDRSWFLRKIKLDKDAIFLYISLWRKKELKELGKDQMPPPPVWTSNPCSHSSTRIILTSDSVIIDTFKHYRPYALEDYYKNKRWKE